MEVGWISLVLAVIGRGRLGWRSAGVLVVLAAITTACDPYIALPPQAIGLSEAPDGTVLVRYVYCRDEALKRVDLFVGAEDDPFVGNRDDRLVWEIVAKKGRQPRPAEFVVGEVPDAFEQTAELRTTLMPDRRYGILINSSIFVADADFTLDEIRTDRILSSGQYFTEAEFRDRGMEKCEVPQSER